MNSLQERVAAFSARKAAGYTAEQTQREEQTQDDANWAEHIKKHGNPQALWGRHEQEAQPAEKSESETQRRAQKQIVKEMLIEIMEEILGEWKAKSREEGT